MLILLQLMFLLLLRHVIVIVRDVSMLQDATVLFSVSSIDQVFFSQYHAINLFCQNFMTRLLFKCSNAESN